MIKKTILTYIIIQLCISETQQNFIMFIIVLERNVSILIESSSGPSKNTDPYSGNMLTNWGINSLIKGHVCNKWIWHLVQKAWTYYYEVQAFAKWKSTTDSQEGIFFMELVHQAQMLAQILCCSERIWMVVICRW